MLEILNDCVFQEGSILILAQYSLRDSVKLILTYPCTLLILTLSFINKNLKNPNVCVSVLSWSIIVELEKCYRSFVLGLPYWVRRSCLRLTEQVGAEGVAVQDVRAFHDLEPEHLSLSSVL